MKTILFFLLLLLVTSCIIEDPLPENVENATSSTNIEDIVIPDDFSFTTTISTDLTLSFFAGKELLKNIPFEIVRAHDNTILLSGQTNREGEYRTSLKLPAFAPTILIRTNYIGVIPETSIEITNANTEIKIGYGENHQTNITYTPQLTRVNSRSGSSLLYMGTWNSSGVPDYLTISDVISSGLLSRMNASLPESEELPISHPQYLSEGNNANLELTDSADVWVTFVHEGAGYKNVLGYYTYTTGSDPATESEIVNPTIVYPNASYSGAGGGLFSGDKVHLGAFPAGTTIGWFIIVNGWVDSAPSESRQRLYSNQNLNPETDASLKQHNVILLDEEENVFLLGFEDIVRNSSSCDQDFNDAVFYATVNPPEAVNINNVESTDIPTDSDNDGVSDKFDEFPSDPLVAYTSSYPALNSYGTLLFEDLWPSKGDYDFNDMVLDYNYFIRRNGENKVVDISASYILRAAGAGFHNGFGIDIGGTSGNISVSDNSSIGSHSEAGQSSNVAIIFDDLYSVLQHPGVGIGINTDVSAPIVEPETVSVAIILNSPTETSDLKDPPYSPFIIANGTRGKEIHLANEAPTDLMNEDLFNTGNDNTVPGLDRYFVTPQGLPWGLDLPYSIPHMKERVQIRLGYKDFHLWASSGGETNSDWYVNGAGDIETSVLYQQ